MGGGGVDSDWAVMPAPPLAEVTIALVGKVGTGKSATANLILGSQAFASEYSPGSVTETCQRSSTTFHDGGGAARTINVIDTPGLFDMKISMEDACKEIVKCIEMSKDGIHALLMVFSAASRFSREEHNAVELIKLFFGDKILDHLILVFTHGDAVGEEVAWKKMLIVKSPAYVQDMLKLCQNRVVLFDNETKGVEHREIQRKKLLAIVDLVISSNNGKAFSYQMLPHVKEANDGQNRNSGDAYSAEKICEHLTRITKTVKYFYTLIQRLMASLEHANKEKEHFKTMYDNKCIVM
uniref:AIG1-type G domain-containing protein n=1 Tax=Hordeum vulgare subsp. vulgare TaxID=112509 RepID=A0A8I6YPS7_HORVV